MIIVKPNQLKYNKVYNNITLRPPVMNDSKLKGNVIFILSPYEDGVVDTICKLNSINPIVYNSYYMERDIGFIINNNITIGESSNYNEKNISFLNDIYSILTESFYMVLDIDYEITENEAYIDSFNTETCYLPNPIHEDAMDFCIFKLAYYILKEKYGNDELNIFIANELAGYGDNLFQISNIINKNYNENDLLSVLENGIVFENSIKLASQELLQKIINKRRYIKRNNTFKSRKGSTHILNRVKKEIESAKTKSENQLKIDTSTQSNNTSSNNDENVEELMLVGDDSNLEPISINDVMDESGRHLPIFETVGDILLFNESAYPEDRLDKLIKRIIYPRRLRNTKLTLKTYKNIKSNCRGIKYTYISLDRYKRRNLFIDTSYYYNIFINNTMGYTRDKLLTLHTIFLKRQLNRAKINTIYPNQSIFINISDFIPTAEDINIAKWNSKQIVNPISMIYYYLKRDDLNTLNDIFGDRDIFLTTSGAYSSYFKINLNREKLSAQKFVQLLKKALKGQSSNSDDDIASASEMNELKKKELVSDTVEILNSRLSKMKPQNLTGDSSPTKEISVVIDDEIEKKIEDLAEKEAVLDSEELANKAINNDEIIEMIASSMEKDVGSRGAELNSRRKKRGEELITKFYNDYKLSEDDTRVAEPIDLKINTIDESWKSVNYMGQSSDINIDLEIKRIFDMLTRCSYPIYTRGISIEDKSTELDAVYYYTVNLEDYNGKRYGFKFYIPKMLDNSYFLLKGNKKTINCQLMLPPISKTGPNTVQLVSNYSKVFIELFGNTTGKSSDIVYRTIKTLQDYKGTGISFKHGNLSDTNRSYDVSVEYLDLSEHFEYIQIKNGIRFIFNNEFLSEIVASRKTKPKDGEFAIGQYPNGEILYSSIDSFGDVLLAKLCEDEEFNNLYKTKKSSTRYMYSRASIMSTKIPLIVLMGYFVGIPKAMEIVGVEYSMLPSRTSKDVDYEVDFIKFKDGYLRYKVNINSSIFMNGLKECPTENYNLGHLESKFMYMELLDKFGGRIKSDGFDNFLDLMVDPITETVLKKSMLPTDFVELLGMANNLLDSNAYSQHTNISDGKRIRRKELIAAYAYQAIASAYSMFSISHKHGRVGSKLTMKETQVIDLFLADPTAGDMSILSPLCEFETTHMISTKGLSGMNADRAYKLEERDYHKSMVGVYGLSTGFAATVGINRQLAIDPTVINNKGFVECKNLKDLGTTQMLCMTEALSPLAATRDDPFRTAMTFTQKSRHMLRTKKHDPLLATYGADKAIGYMVSDIFCYKAKDKGKVLEINEKENYMIIQYDKSNEKVFVDLSERVEKNSSSGFFIGVKLDTNLKPGSRFTKNEIIAYDKSSFNTDSGDTPDITYSMGTLTKCAILNNDEGYEDSAIISKALTHALETEIIDVKEINLAKDASVLQMVKVGDRVIIETNPIITIQNGYNDEDATKLSRLLARSGLEEDEISDLGRVQIKSKVDGVIQDIKIYRTVNLEELSPSLKDICIKYENKINKRNKLKGLDNYEFKLEKNGKVKDTEGVLIEFYIKTNIRMSTGDKMIYTNALKGVVKDIFPEGEEPYSEFRQNERVETLLNEQSINSRMVTSVYTNGGINKVLVELSRRIKDMAGIPYRLNLLDED